MVTLEASYERIKELIGHEVEFDKFEEAIVNLGMELEDKNADQLTIDITAERPDLVSSEGIARAIKAMLGYKTKEYTAEESDYEVIIEESVKKVRPYTACAVIKNLKFDDEKIKEVIWVQEKLHATFGRNRKKAAIGIYPLERIEFPITFKADKPEKIFFRPLESDEELDGHEILTKTETGKAYAHLMRGLDKYAYFIDANSEILSMPPIINSERTGRVTEDTKEVFIECSGFDYKALSQMLNIIVCMFHDFGGKIFEVKLKYPDEKKTTPELDPEKRKMSVEYVNKTTGIKLTSKQIISLLEKMMYTIKKSTSKTIEFEVPAFRTDIWHDIDVVDDIVRAYGINNIIPELPLVPTDGKTFFETRLKTKIEELMIGIGFQETFTYALTNKESQYKMMNIKEEKHISLGKTTEQSINMVRTWLLPELLKSLANNKNKEYPQKLFEVEEVVIPDSNTDVQSRNVTKMSCVIADNDSNYTKAKQVLTYVLETLGIKIATYEAEQHNSFLDGRCASIKLNGKKMCVLGEINPVVLGNFGIKYPVCAFEINIEELSRYMNEKR